MEVMKYVTCSKLVKVLMVTVIVIRPTCLAVDLVYCGNCVIVYTTISSRNNNNNIVKKENKTVKFIVYLD